MSGIVGASVDAAARTGTGVGAPYGAGFCNGLGCVDGEYGDCEGDGGGGDGDRGGCRDGGLGGASGGGASVGRVANSGVDVIGWRPSCGVCWC